MRATQDIQREQLRMQIARSRRRLDLRARQLAANVQRGVSVGRSMVPASGRSWLLILAAGFLLSRWGLGSHSLADWRHRLLGSTVSFWLDRLSRQLRVMAWHYRRAAQPAPTETERE